MAGLDVSATVSRLRHHDHGGVGTLELLRRQGAASPAGATPSRPRRRRARWSTSFETLVDGQRALRRVRGARRRGAVPPLRAPRWTRARTSARVAARDFHSPPSTWTLFRLWRFARPYKRQLVRRLRADAGRHRGDPGAALPHHAADGQGADPVPERACRSISAWSRCYLAGLLGSALLAWGLGWARTYILALVSERIGADLRTTTYEHLLGLSLEFFGGKRTGDLMARIGADTDRICIFLSLHLLDFATDVLMITLTAAILFSINPWLALVTLLPLPFIAWMIHVVRERLRTGFEKIDRVWSEVTSVLADTIPGIRVVKAFAQEQREAERFREANQHNLAANDRLNRVWALFSPTVSLLTEVGLLVVWAVRHLAGVAQRDHGRRADRVPGLHQPLLHPARVDEPHRLGDAEGGRRREAHLRDPRPRVERARAGAARCISGRCGARSRSATWRSATATGPSSAAST